MKTVVLHSGGLDSTVLLFLCRQMGEVLALHLHYGQRHAKELAAARSICSTAGIPQQEIDLRSLGLFGGSSLTDFSMPVPEGHYAAESMKSTVVPNRNMVLLSLATAVAIERGFDQVAYAAHAGDHPIYPDCRPGFVAAMAEAISAAGDGLVALYAPFGSWAKSDIALAGARIGAPMGETWSCYQGGDLHCGRCGTCVERREAFLVAGIADPTLYQG